MTDLEGLRHLVEEPQYHSVSRGATLSAIGGLTVNPLFSNPIIQSAVQVLDQIADIGKVLPFVAPAFVLLKVIIDMEMKAQDVDAKCNDLIERITFMLSHLPVLQTVEINTSTRQVVERINGALQDATALITAYRKQGRIARRLSLNNRDKFTTCVETINVCCNDLIMSLQIHQTGRLEILTRAVPVDAEDEAACKFVASHGSLDAIKRSAILVNEFAEQQHLTMDDQVMEQLNANITDTIQENNIRLEAILKGNIGATIIDGLKGLVAEMHAAEAQQHFKCVQCDKEFTVATNGPKACSFHRAQYSNWDNSFPCCGNSQPCQFQSHRENHHCDYPYAAFFPRVQAIQNYIDTVDVWASVEDLDLESDIIQKASVGRLLRWVSRGERIAEPTILITVGSVWHNKPYFFDTYTTKELDSVSRFIALTQQTLIYRTSPSESEFAMAEWVLSSESAIRGVRVTSKSATSPSAFVRVCLFDTTNFKKSGDTLTLSEGGISSYKPNAPYFVPETIRISPDLSDEQLRLPRTDFKTRTTNDLPVTMKAMSDPPLTANPELAANTMDHFRGVVSVFNNSPANIGIPITIASVSATYRFVGDTDNLPVSSVKILDSSQLPVTIDPRQSWPLKFEVSVLRSKEDASLNVRWWNRAFMARHRPLRIKLILESIEGEQCSLVLEYVFKMFPLEKAKDGDLGFFYIDNPILMERWSIRVEIGGDGQVVRINNTDIDAKRLEKVVYRAIKTGATEIDLGIGQEKHDGAWEWVAWALVDISCRRVYAFKILLQQGKLIERKTTCCLGYALCPPYGNAVDRSKPICYATETVNVSALEPFPVVSYATDDSLDDYVPEGAKKTPISVTEGPPAPVQFAISDELNQRLNSIDSNLSRIATALEQLSDALRTRLS